MRVYLGPANLADAFQGNPEGWVEYQHFLQQALQLRMMNVHDEISDLGFVGGVEGNILVLVQAGEDRQAQLIDICEFCGLVAVLGLLQLLADFGCGDRLLEGINRMKSVSAVELINACIVQVHRIVLVVLEQNIARVDISVVEPKLVLDGFQDVHHLNNNAEKRLLDLRLFQVPHSLQVSHVAE